MSAKKKNECTSHRIKLCKENRATVIDVEAEIKKIHQTSFDEAINLIIERYRDAKVTEKKD